MKTRKFLGWERGCVIHPKGRVIVETDDDKFYRVSFEVPKRSFLSRLWRWLKNKWGIKS